MTARYGDFVLLKPPFKTTTLVLWLGPFNTAVSYRNGPGFAGENAQSLFPGAGFVMMAYFWALQADKAYKYLSSGQGAESAAFYRAKIQTAEFYFDRLLPRTLVHAAGVRAGAASVTTNVEAALA